MAFRRMVSMVRTPEEKEEEYERYTNLADDETPDVPAGLCVCLTEAELEKLDVDYEDVEKGDFLHMFAMGVVTNVTKIDSSAGKTCRIEMALVGLGIEDESTEAEPD